MNSIKLLGAIVMAVLVITSMACEKRTQPATANQFKPTASVQEIMKDIIDPNIDYVWNSVATISTKKGTEERKPKTDEDWALVRQHAVVVLEASNLLLIEGRPIAATGANTSTHQVELGPEEVQKAIAADRAAFVGYAHALHDAMQQTIGAVDKKNVEGLIEYGSAVDHVCEECHKRFWYPNDKRPTTVPTKHN